MRGWERKVNYCRVRTAQKKLSWLALKRVEIQLNLSVDETTSGWWPFTPCAVSLIRFSFHCRANSKGYDLNRNFPDIFKQNAKRTQPETEAVKDWISKIQFVLSGSLHGGALVRPIVGFRPSGRAEIAIEIANFICFIFYFFRFRWRAIPMITLRMPVSVHS